MADDAVTPIPEPEQGRQDNRQTRQVVNEAILINARRPRDRRKSIRALAADLGVAPTVIYDQRQRLRARGMLPDFKPKHGLPAKSAPVEGDSVASHLSEPASSTPLSLLMTMIDKIEVPDAQQRRKVLAFVIENGDDQRKVLAIRALEEMDAGLGEGIGPKTPLDALERRERLARLMLMCGQKEVEGAFRDAFPNAKPRKTPIYVTNEQVSASQAVQGDAPSSSGVD